jgi:hypothetical protein
LGENKVHLILQIVMSSSYEYSCSYELEYSHVDMFFICELAYSPFIMFMSYLDSYSHVSINTVYELVYSPHIMYVLYLAQSFNVHIMFMN